MKHYYVIYEDHDSRVGRETRVFTDAVVVAETIRYLMDTESYNLNEFLVIYGEKISLKTETRVLLAN